MSVESQETPPPANQSRIEDRSEPLTNQQGQQSSSELVSGTQAITRYTFWLVAFTGVLALATLVLAAYTIRLEYTTRDSAQRQLRAYVGVLNGSIRLVNLREGGQGPESAAIFSNAAYVNDQPLPVSVECYAGYRREPGGATI